MELWASLIYLLCLLTSFLCAVLLIRSYRRTRTRLLLWSAACFALLSVNNLLMVLDILIFPDIDLGLARSLCTLAAAGTMIYGFIWELD
jgi:hypothetical protein